MIEQRRAIKNPVFRSVSREWIAAVILFVAVVGVFTPSLFHDFINLDDSDYVTKNPMIQAGLRWPGLVWSFGFHAANWHPLTWISHMLDCQLFGTRPLGHHLTNIVFHSVNAVLLFLLLNRMTDAFWRSLFVAALFAFHPLHVESVSWISERKDVLSTFFWILTLLTYVIWTQQNRRPKAQYVMSLVFFVCGLLSKSMVVTTPFLLLLLDYWPLQRLSQTNMKANGRLLVEKVPFFLLSAAVSALTVAVQRSGGAVRSFTSFPIDLRIANTFISYCRYLGKVFWPYDLIVYYPYPYSWPPSEGILAFLVIAGISVTTVLGRKSYPSFFVGWFWFIGTLVPVIGIVQVGTQSIADRYTYFPAIGIFIALTWSVTSLVECRPRTRWFLGTASVAAVVFCLVLTVRQQFYWRDSETLFRHALTAGYNGSVAELHLGMALNDRGENEEALVHLRAAMQYNPRNPYTRLTLSYVLDEQGHTAEAVTEIQEALKLLPKLASAHFFNGLLLEKLDRPKEAEFAYVKAAELDPDLPVVRYNLGVILDRDGKPDEAMAEYRAELKVNPGLPEAHNNLGKDLLIQQRIDEAVAHFRAAIATNPNFAEAHNNLGGALYLQGKRVEAIAEFREALRLQPQYQDANNNLESALNDLGTSK